MAGFVRVTMIDNYRRRVSGGASVLHRAGDAYYVRLPVALDMAAAGAIGGAVGGEDDGDVEVVLEAVQARLDALAAEAAAAQSADDHK